MATNNPTLEQLTGSLDSLPDSLDNLDALPWCNPTLEQLDGWGSLEYIASFGYTLEQLDNSDRLCVVVASGSASIELSTTAEIQLPKFVEAAESISLAVDAEANAIFAADASPVLSITVASDGHVLGEDWGDIADGAEIWTDVIVGSEIWAHVPVGNEVWARQ
jgi:hypothetical protein